MTELVYDLIYPTQSTIHVQALKAMSDQTFSDVRSVRSLSSFGSLSDRDEHGWDLTCPSGIENYLSSVKVTSITKNRLEGGHFLRRLDGLRHASWPVSGVTCQYCHYQYSHVLKDDQKQKGVLDWTRQNRKTIRRCLVCNVNLCPFCENEFHGIMMSDTARILGKK